MTPDERMTVTLEAQQWEAAMRVLADGPYRIVAPLIAEIQRQCMAGQQMPAMPPNGSAEAQIVSG